MFQHGVEATNHKEKIMSILENITPSSTLSNKDREYWVSFLNTAVKRNLTPEQVFTDLSDFPQELAALLTHGFEWMSEDKNENLVKLQYWTWAVRVRLNL